jgi:hypothetical protein
MENLLLNPQTAKDISLFLQQTSHAVLLSGEAGHGKASIASELAAKLLGLSTAKLVQYPYFSHIQPIKGTLTIDQVRELQRFLQLKTTGQAAIRRVALLEDAHCMNHEAQNALLKILEEPPADSVIVVTAVPDHALLPTVYSRLQQIRVQSVSVEAAMEFYLAKGFTAKDIQKAYMLSAGSVGLLDALLHESNDHPLVASIERAKEILTKPRYERILQVDSWSKDREAVPLLLQACKRVASAAMTQAAANDKSDMVRHWHAVASEIQIAEQQLARTANLKLLLTKLFLSV